LTGTPARGIRFLGRGKKTFEKTASGEEIRTVHAISRRERKGRDFWEPELIISRRREQEISGIHEKKKRKTNNNGGKRERSPIIGYRLKPYLEKGREEPNILIP